MKTVAGVSIANIFLYFFNTIYIFSLFLYFSLHWCNAWLLCLLLPCLDFQNLFLKDLDSCWLYLTMSYLGYLSLKVMCCGFFCYWELYRIYRTYITYVLLMLLHNSCFGLLCWEGCVEVFLSLRYIELIWLLQWNYRTIRLWHPVHILILVIPGNKNGKKVFRFVV